MLLKKVPLQTPLPLFYIGRDLALDLEENLPCIIYLALSAEESLSKTPFNQPVNFFLSHSVRVFSVDLPFHGNDLLATEGMKKWADEFSTGNNILASFLNDLETSLKLLFKAIAPSKIAIMGLSRGGFLASHIAARMPEISSLLCYAPLTQISQCLEFTHLKDSSLIQSLNISALTADLYQKKIKVYIGNRDLRVGTDLCYTWLNTLIDEAFLHGIRSPQIELVLKPSIGYLGHGTSKETFEEGALWLAQKLEIPI